MRVILIAALLAMLAGCASTATQEQQAPAGVEDRSRGATGAQSQGVESRPVTGAELAGQNGGGTNPLTDPSNILSKRSIYYDFDKFDVKDEYKPMIEAHAAYLRNHPDAKVLIQGNTDERGSREYNVALGQRRADGVKKLLLLLGAKQDQVEAVSLGEEKPKAQGTSEEAYAQNRRCDILYKGEY
ncbi:MAG TPA: peptidoglycan-associated lipoprotein Pal [Burkholderiales bacterium]|nr:peptidoglycan-associated lipoprotein Pal [Burkholderiales bacterium]